MILIAVMGHISFRNYYIVPYDTSSYPNNDSKSGICFSPNGKLLYMSNMYTIYQIDIEDTNKNNALFITGPDTTISQFPWYNLTSTGPDGKMYIGTFSGSYYMSYIDSPNIKGLGCHFIPHGIWQPYTGLLDPPNMPNYGLGKAPVGGNCWPDRVEEFANESDNNLQVFPNPASSILFIKTSLSSKRELYNALGQLIYTTTKNEIDVSKFAKGMYYLRCGFHVKKVIIE